MGDSSRAIFGRGQLFDETELNYISTALIDEMLARTANLVRVPGVFLPNGALTDNNLKVTAVDADTVAVAVGCACDDLGQFIEVVAPTTVAVSAGTYALILLWSYTDGTAGTFETGYGPGYSRRSRSYTLTLTAWPNTVDHSVLLAKVVADGINPAVVTDARTGAQLHWANVDWTSYKAGLADCILAQGIPTARLDLGTGSTYFLTSETPASSGASVTVAIGHGLTTAADIVKLTTACVVAVPDDSTYYKVRILPSATFGGESTADLVGYSATGGFYVARVKRTGTTLLIEDVRTKLLMRSLADQDAVLPVAPTRLRAMWGFDKLLRQRVGEEDMSQHMQGQSEGVWIKVKFGDGGTGYAPTANTFLKQTNEIGAWTTNEWAGHQVRVGTQYFPIVSNTDTTLTVSGTIVASSGTAFDIVPGGSKNVFRIQSKWNTVVLGSGEVEELGAVGALAEMDVTAFRTTKTNSTWTQSQVFAETELQQEGVNYEGASVLREIVFHNLPAAVPYRIQVQSRGGPTSEFWSPWSEWVIIKPVVPLAQRNYLTPAAGIISIVTKPGGLIVVTDFSGASAAIKAAADKYYAATEVTYTEGESQSGLSGLLKTKVPTPVLSAPWTGISAQTTKQVQVVSPARNIQIMTEPRCKVRIVVRCICRDGTCTPPKEFAIEDGTPVCVDPRAEADGQGTQVGGLDDVISSGGGGASSSYGIVEQVAYAREIVATAPALQTVRTLYMLWLYGSSIPPDGIPANDVYYRLRTLGAYCGVTPDSQWYVKVTAMGTGVSNKVWLMTPATGPVGHLLINEVLKLQQYRTIVIQIYQDSGGSQPGQDVHISLSSNIEPSYIPLSVS